MDRTNVETGPIPTRNGLSHVPRLSAGLTAQGTPLPQRSWKEGSWSNNFWCVKGRVALYEPHESDAKASMTARQHPAVATVFERSAPDHCDLVHLTSAWPEKWAEPVDKQLEEQANLSGSRCTSAIRGVHFVPVYWNNFSCNRQE